MVNFFENSRKTLFRHKTNFSSWISGAMVVGTALILQYSLEASDSKNVTVEKKVPEKVSSTAANSSSESTTKVNGNFSRTSETTFESVPSDENTTSTITTTADKKDHVDNEKKQRTDKETDNNSKEVPSDDGNLVPDLNLSLILTWKCISILAEVMNLHQNPIFHLGLTLAEKIVLDGFSESSIVLDTPRRLSNEELASKGSNSSSESNIEDLSNITDRVKNFLEACHIPFMTISSSSSLSTITSATPPSNETISQPVTLSSVSATDSGTIDRAASTADITNPTSTIMETNQPSSRDLFIRNVVNDFLKVYMQVTINLKIYDIVSSPMTNRTLDELNAVASYPMFTIPEYVETMAGTLQILNRLSIMNYHKSLGDWCAGTHLETRNRERYSSPESEMMTKMIQLVGVAFVSYYVAQKFTFK